MNGLTLLQILDHHDAIHDAIIRRLNAEFKALKAEHPATPIPHGEFKEFLAYQEREIGRWAEAHKTALDTYTARKNS